MARPQYPGRVTLQDIARETGYTVNTVSHALKNKSDISPATREKIQQVAQRMGYVRNYVASSLRSGRTKIIAVILGGMSNPYYALMSDEIQKEASSLGYSLIILCSRDDPDLEYSAAETAVSRQVDGVLLFPGKEYSRTEELLRASGTPFILMSRYTDADTADTAVCDEVQGAYLAVSHLLEQGHRKVAMLSAGYVPFASEKRTEGFLKACADAGIADAEKYVAVRGGNEDILKQLLAWRAEGVTGVFSFCDVEAWNIITLLNGQGIRVPEDMGIVGFDDIQGRYSFPAPLCTVSFDIPRMCAEAVHLLRRRIHHEDLARQETVYPVRLVCRGSCGCGAKKK